MGDALAPRLHALSISGDDAAPAPPPAAAVTGPAPAAQGSARVAGGGEALSALRELIGWPVLYAEEAEQLGVTWPRGMLLHGPPGCGKTLMVQAVAEEFGATMLSATASSVFGAYVGESERRLRDTFQAASSQAAAGKLVVVFLDEVDALCPRRQGPRPHEARVVAQLLTLLDGAAGLDPSPAGPQQQQQQRGAAVTAQGGAGRGGDEARGAGVAAPPPGRVVVVGATNRPNAVDPALRRPGRLDREVEVSVPDDAQRADILRLHTAGLKLAAGVDLAAVAASCHGYSGADLAALAREAGMSALSAAAAALYPPPAASHAAVPPTTTPQPPRALPPDQNQPAATRVNIGPAELGAAFGAVTAADFASAMKRVGPSIVRGDRVDAGPAGWDDIGGLAHVKKRVRQAVEWPLKHAAAFERLGVSAPRGVLLHGPPGCSKTRMARAAAATSGATLLPLSCAQLYSMYLGEGEAQLRDVFRRARLAAPSIVFLDEVDAVAPSRGEAGGSGGAGAGGGGGGGGSDSSLRLLATLLTEMDGLQLATGVLVLAATNRPGALDPALLRPGRLDVLLYVPPPDAEGRLEVLHIHTRHMPLAADVDLAALAADMDRFTGAEVAAVCREAAMAALREDVRGAACVAQRHFMTARLAMTPALSADDVHRYADWRPGRGA